MQYRLLGPLEVVRDGGPLELGPPKQRAVLAVLLLEAGRVVPTDRIVQAVWGDHHPPSVTAGLQSYISHLRRLLRDGSSAPSPILRRAPGYLIDVAPEGLDRTAFLSAAEAAQHAIDAGEWATAVREAERALSLWRGPVLADLQDEEWVRVASGALEERRIACAESLITGLMGCGRTDEAVAVARPLQQEHPLRERSCRLLLVALYRCGRTAEALEAYRDHARDLSEELGLEPGPALRELYESILRHDPEPACWPVRALVPGGAEAQQAAASAGSAASGGSVASAAPDVSPVPDVSAGSGRIHLVGRDEEVRRIRSTVGAAVTDTRWIVLTGPAGIGKTRLAEVAAAACHATGGSVVRTTCPEDDGVPAWWPVRRIVRHLGGEPDAILTPPPDTEPDAARFGVYERLLDLFDAASGSAPLLVVVDDVQWADSASLRWLTHLAEGLGTQRLILVCTVRDDAGGPDLQRLLAAVARNPGTVHIDVPPLRVPQVRALAELITGEPLDHAEAERLTRRTGGNPFLITEYARLPPAERRAGELPLAVRSVLERRLSGLDAEVLQVLRIAAVMGDPLDVDVLCPATGLDREALADLIDAAAAEHILVIEPGTSRYVFAHGLLREAILAGLSAPRRQRLHARVARTLQNGTDTDDVARRATHLLAALPLAEPSAAFAACRDAALDAERRWLTDSAAHWWGAALQVYDRLPATVVDDEHRDDLLVSRVSALARAGRGQTVLDTVDAALQEAIRHGRVASAGRLAAALLRTAGAWPWASNGDDPGRLLARLAGIEPLAVADPAAHARVLAALAVGSYYDPDPGVRDRLSGRALAEAESLGDRDVLADALLGRILAVSGVAAHAEESIRLLDRLGGLPHRLDRVDGVLRRTLLTLALLIRGDIPGVIENMRAGVAGADTLRLPVCRVQFRWIEASIALWQGDLRRAEALYRRAYDVHRQTELYLMGVHDLAVLTVRWEQGRLAEVPDVPLSNRAMMPWARAAMRIVHGDRAGAEAIIRARPGRPMPPIWTTHGELTLLAHVLADARMRTPAEAVLGELEPLAGCVANIGQIGIVGPVALAAARLRALLGDTDTARLHLRRARDLTERTGARCGIVRCRLLAAQLDGAGAGEFEAVAEAAARLGMQGVVRDARAAAGT